MSDKKNYTAERYIYSVNQLLLYCEAALSCPNTKSDGDKDFFEKMQVKLTKLFQDEEQQYISLPADPNYSPFHLINKHCIKPVSEETLQHPDLFQIRNAVTLAPIGATYNLVTLFNESRNAIGSRDAFLDSIDVEQIYSILSADLKLTRKFNQAIEKRLMSGEHTLDVIFTLGQTEKQGLFKTAISPHL